jgi:phosphoglycolate phosphatase-like HAD superfamily hydrolase
MLSTPPQRSSSTRRYALLCRAIPTRRGAPEAIVIGGTPYHAEAAAKAGLRTFGLRSGGWSDNDLTRAGGIAVFEDPADLLARYGESPLASP